MQMVENEPLQGPVDSLVERLQSYIARVDPSFPQRCVPADMESIERYSRLAGFGTRERLPPPFRAFLEGMGRQDGGLLRSCRVEGDIVSILRLYEHCVKSEAESLNPELPVVAMFRIGGQISLDLRTSSADPPVVETSEGEFAEVLSRSWEWFLMQSAMSWVAPRLYPYSWVYTGSANSMNKASPLRGGATPEEFTGAFLTREGMTLAWPSEERHQILQTEDSVVFVDFHEGGGVMICSYSRREPFCRINVRTLASALGAESDGPVIDLD
jgi:hypothetical protein